MRRGLISRSKAELPDAVLDARLALLDAAMAAAGLDACLIYTNNTRPAGVSWLTGFVPYWSEALLVVGRAAAPVLVVALTYRVKSWIERTSRVAEVIHTPRIGLEAARLISAAKSDVVVGVADLDGLPAGIAADLREGGARLTFRDATAELARLRGKADPAEIALALRAASIAHRALSVKPPADGDLCGLIAEVEARARRLGAEEIYIAAAPDLARERRLRRIEGEAALGEDFALRATVAYKGTWIRMTRTFARDGGGEEAASLLAAAAAGLPSARGFASFSSWLVEGCRISQPLEPLIGSRISEPQPPLPGMLVSVQAAGELDGRAALIAGPALIGTRGEAASLLLPPIWPSG